MAPISARDLTSRFDQDRISIPVPGGGDLLCRKPSLPELIFEQLIPMPLLQQVLQAAAGLDPKSKTAQELTLEVIANHPEYLEFMNRWVCAAVLEPRIVMEKPEPGVDAVWVKILPLGLRSTIFEQTFMGFDEAVRMTAGTFPVESDGDALGPDGAPVQPAPVGDGGDRGPRAGVRLRPRARHGRTKH